MVGSRAIVRYTLRRFHYLRVITATGIRKAHGDVDTSLIVISNEDLGWAVLRRSSPRRARPQPRQRPDLASPDGIDSFEGILAADGYLADDEFTPRLPVS